MSQVPDEEILYRRVFPSRGHCSVVGGELKISSQAFTDRECEPSVDLASLCEGGAAWTQQGDKAAGVLRLVVRDVRAVRITHDKVEPSLDVDPRPLADNVAHAVVVPEPSPKNPKALFRKTIERLAILAAPELLPADFAGAV